MELKISVNFDFEKLSGKIDSLIDSYVEETAEKSAILSKKTIDSGKLAPLKTSTLRWRRSKGYPLIPPLKASGSLYNSIKTEQNTLVMNDYGKFHNDGTVPTTGARPFIAGLAFTNIKEREKINKKFLKNVNKALSSKKVIVSF